MKSGRLDKVVKKSLLIGMKDGINSSGKSKAKKSRS